MINFIESLPERFSHYLDLLIASILVALENLPDATFRITRALVEPLYPFAMIMLAVTSAFAFLFLILVLIG